VSKNVVLIICRVWQPCDPTEYQNDDIGKVIGMY